MSETHKWIAASLRASPGTDHLQSGHLTGPLCVVLYMDHAVVVANAEHRIRELEGQLANARRDGLNEAAELEVQLGHDLARVCGPDFTSGYESGVEALRIALRARLKELDE